MFFRFGGKNFAEFFTPFGLFSIFQQRRRCIGQAVEGRKTINQGQIMNHLVMKNQKNKIVSPKTKLRHIIGLAIALLASCLVYAGSVSAADFYVCQNQTTCNEGVASSDWGTPSSDSAACGTKQAPCSTIQAGISRMNGEDTLIIGDGTYHESLTDISSGTDGAHTVIKAENTGKVIIQSEGTAIEIRSTSGQTFSYITIEGLIARSSNESPAIVVTSPDNIGPELMSHHITIRKTGAFGSVRSTNANVISIGRTRDSLFEDIFAYGPGRATLSVFGSLRITVRRAVLRYDYWDGLEYKLNDPRIVLTAYNTHDSIFENIIAFDAAESPTGDTPEGTYGGISRAGIVAAGNATAVSTISGSENNKYLGSISLNNVGSGFEIDGGSGDPNANNTFENNIAWDNTAGGLNVQKNDDGTLVTDSTFGENHIVGVRYNPDPGESQPITNGMVQNCFATHNGGGVNPRGGYYSYSDYIYTSTQITTFENNTSINHPGNPDIEPAYAPTLSNFVRPEYVAGHERGATIVNRYSNGLLTNEALWPWPLEDIIYEHMCNQTDLQEVGRLTQDIPGWCESQETLTSYIWEYLGNEIPCDIYGACATPVITTTILPEASVGESYSQIITATGGDTPYAWDLSVGALPDGLSLSQSQAGDNAVISGTPTTDGVVTFTVRVTDSSAETDAQELTIRVIASAAEADCGNSICNSGEDNDSCPEDCPPGVSEPDDTNNEGGSNSRNGSDGSGSSSGCFIQSLRVHP